MTTRMRVLTIGAVAGALGGALTMVAGATLDRAPGGALGLLAATAAGAFAARLGADLIGRRVAAHFALLDEANREQSAPPPLPLEWGTLDDAIDSLKQA